MRYGRLIAPLLLLVNGCSTTTPPPPGSDLGSNDHPVVIIHDPGRQPAENEAIRAYRDFLAQASGEDPRRAVAERRIAYLYLREAEAANLRPGQNRRAARLFGKAIDAFQSLLDEDQGAYRDDLLYALAHAYEGTADKPRMLQTLNTLARLQPASPYRAEALFRLAEGHFSAGNSRTALPAYREVIALGKDTPFYFHARYKLAWAALAEGHTRQAGEDFLSLLEALLAQGQRSLQSLSASRRPLVEDSLRGLALAAMARGGVTALESLHGDRQAEFLPLLYEALGEQQLAIDDAEAAIRSWRRFAEHYPDEPAAARFWIRIYRLQQQLGQKAAAQFTQEQFIRRYGADSPFWRQHELRDYPDIAGALSQLLRKMAQTAHAEARKNGRQAAYQRAAQRYQDYLKLFNDDPSAPDIRYLLAELFDASGDKQAAIQAYEDFAYHYPGDKRAGEAAYAALQLSAEEEPASFFRRTQRFINTFASHPQAPLILAHSASKLLAEGQVDLAMAAADRVINWPRPVPADARRTVLLMKARQAFADQAFAAAEQAYRQLLSLAGTSATLQRDLTEDLALAIYRQGEQASEAGADERAAEHFLRVRRLAPGSRIEPTAEFDAINALFAAGRWQDAVPLLQRFGQRYPGHELQKTIPNKLAVALLKSGQKQQAADVLAGIAETADEADIRREALSRAAELYRETGDKARAATLYRRFVSRYPEPFQEAQPIRRLLADMALEQGRRKEWKHWLQAMVEHAAGQPPPLPLAATAALQLANDDIDDYRRLQLTLPLQKSLSRKKALLERVLKRYRQAAGYGIASVTTEATFHLAEAYHEFSRALLAAERPQDLSGDDLEDYIVLLEDQAEPFESRAIELHEGNLKRLQEDIYDRWIAASLEQLATMFPARYRRQERGAAVIVMTGEQP